MKMGKVKMVVVNRRGVLEYPFTFYRGKKVPYDTKPRKPINRTKECLRRQLQAYRIALKTGDKNG